MGSDDEGSDSEVDLAEGVKPGSKEYAEAIIRSITDSEDGVICTVPHTMSFEHYVWACTGDFEGSEKWFRDFPFEVFLV